MDGWIDDGWWLSPFVSPQTAVKKGSEGSCRTLSTPLRCSRFLNSDSCLLSLDNFVLATSLTSLSLLRTSLIALPVLCSFYAYSSALASTSPFASLFRPPWRRPITRRRATQDTHSTRRPFRHCLHRVTLTANTTDRRELPVTVLSGQKEPCRLSIAWSSIRLLRSFPPLFSFFVAEVDRTGQAVRSLG